jgi:rhodanese-related sulfurtransferase
LVTQITKFRPNLVFICKANNASMKLFFSLTCLLFGVFCTKVKAQDSAIKRLRPAEFIAAIAKDSVQLYDVRTLTEFTQGHLKGAKKVDFLNPKEFELYFESKDTLRPIYLYCRSGNRSLRAAQYLQKRGFQEIYELRGGYFALPDSIRKANR